MIDSKNQRAPKRREIFRRAWREIAPEDTFAGMTLAEFEESTADVEQTREEIAALQTQLSALRRSRGKADAAFRDLSNMVVNGVRGHPKHGRDSPLYRSMGYVPKSERESGLVRPPRDLPNELPNGAQESPAPDEPSPRNESTDVNAD